MSNVSLNAKKRVPNDSPWKHFSVREATARVRRLNERVVESIQKKYNVELRTSKTHGVALRGDRFAVDRCVDIVDDLLDSETPEYARGMLGLQANPKKRNEGETVLYMKIDETYISRLIGKGGSMIRHIAKQNNAHIWYNNDKKRLEIASTRIRNCERAEAEVKARMEKFRNESKRGERRKARSPTTEGSSTSSSC